MKKQTLREKLIDAIFEYSGDEWADLDTKEYIQLAKESEEELVDIVINILNWYYDEYNS